MSKKTEQIILSVLGKSTYEKLNKAIVKIGTKSVVDIGELHDSLAIAPKSIIAFLMKELKDMKKDETKEIKVPWEDNCILMITKSDNDVYKGKIAKDGKVADEFALCSIPQLSAHLLSYSEMYDEVPNQQEASEKSENDQQKSDISNMDGLKDQFRSLNDKINSLLLLVAGRGPEPVVEMQKTEELGKKKELTKKQILAGKLKKAGVMPSPPKAGSNVGGSQGITRAGIHGPKTAVTDMHSPRMGAAPKGGTPKAIKAPLAQSEKSLVMKKSELIGKCEDCGQVASHCACFKALSAPKIQKIEGDKVTLKFGLDWDSESVSALYKSIKRSRNE